MQLSVCVCEIESLYVCLYELVCVYAEFLCVYVYELDCVLDRIELVCMQLKKLKMCVCEIECKEQCMGVYA